MSQAFADAAESLIADQGWPQLLAIADQLPFAQHVADLIRPLARQPDQPQRSRVDRSDKPNAGTTQRVKPPTGKKDRK